MIRPFVLACMVLVFSISLEAQSSVAPDIAEVGSVEEIAKATTEAQFLSPWVSYIPVSAQVPSPRGFYGRMMGAPGELVDSTKAYAYCRALAARSPRVRVFTIGKSEEGRDILLLAIADDGERQGVAHFMVLHRALQIVAGVDGAAVHGHDDIPKLNMPCLIAASAA